MWWHYHCVDVTHPKCANLVLHDILMLSHYEITHSLDVFTCHTVIGWLWHAAGYNTESATELKHLLYGIETVETVLSGGLHPIIGHRAYILRS